MRTQLESKMKIKNNLFYLFVFALSYAKANNSTEAGTLCLDGALCISHTPSLSKLVESIPQCPQFILRQQILRDEKSSLTTTSPNEICSVGTVLNYFDNAHAFESYLQQNPHFSNLNTSTHFSSCLSQGVLFSTGLGKTFHIQEKFLPEHKKQLAVAEYYSSLRRLSDGVERSLQNITAIDLMIGNNSLLEDVSCNSFDSLSQDVTNQCRTAQQCPSNNSSSLQESAKDTLLALQAVEAIEKEIRRIKNVTFMKFTERQEKMKELRERQQNIQRFYPWISGKVFKEGYNAQDYTNYAESSDESKSEMEAQIAGLIQDQLTHTREKLKERTEDFLKASDCIKGEESLCEELDVEKILAKAPPINYNEVFERDRREELKSKMEEERDRQEELKDKMEEENLSPEERQEYRRLLTKVGSADGLFQQVSCLQTQRKAVSDVNRELALGVLDVGVVIGTMGLGTPLMAGRIALRLGSTAKNLSKAKRIQNLGIFGTDVSFSAPYMKEAMNICEDKLNQLEETTAEPNNKLCEKLPIQVKHTSDLKSCILQVSLASLPITLPILGLSGMAVAKGLRGGKPSSSIPSNATTEKVEEVLDDVQMAKTTGQTKSSKVIGRSVFTKGVDSADRMVSLAQKLRNSQINPHTTHIPEFADDIPKHIEWIEEGIKKSGKNVRKKLKTLNKLKKEAVERINNQQVTYEWWLNWNQRLSDIEDLLSEFRKSTVQRNIPAGVEKFPDIILFPTNSDLGITAMNRLISQKVFPLGLANKPTVADGQLMAPHRFFYHDLSHFGEYLKDKKRYTSSIEEDFNINLYQEFQKLDLPLEQREMIENIYFQIWHELYGIRLFKIGNKFDARIFPAGEMMYKVLALFQKKGDYREFLPDSVNADSAEDIQNYLEDSMDLFGRLTNQIIEASQ